jgi:hypothetical protein
MVHHPGLGFWSSSITNNPHFLKRARNSRNELLNKTDRYFLIDYPIA